MQPDSITRRGGPMDALLGAHPDLWPLAMQQLDGMPTGAEFTAAQFAERLPSYADDKPARLGALIRELNRKGYVEFHSYGPRAIPGDWDSPARVWRRTSKSAVKGGAAT